MDPTGNAITEQPISHVPEANVILYRSNNPAAGYFYLTFAWMFGLSAFLSLLDLIITNYHHPWSPGLFLILSVWTMLFSLFRWKTSSIDKITLTSEGILFPRKWKYSLLNELFRPWSDIHSVDFDGNCRPSDIANWRAQRGSSITLDFKSGGSVLLEVSGMERSRVEELLLMVERQAGQSTLSQKASLFERSLLSVDCAIPITYETIWTDALETQFGATNFVPLATGDTLQSGRYEVRMQLASGGFSAVYLARQGANTRVILKESTVPPGRDQRTQEKAKELFEREAKLLAKIDHPSISKVLDCFIEDGRDYIVLEFIPGVSLRQLVQRDGAQPADKVIQWAVQIAEILSYLHGLEPAIIHRDITPDNLIVRDQDKIALIDFGVSNEFVRQATGTMVGKQAYIPPEQIRGRSEPRSDVYALGATLYFLLVGVDPEPLSISRPSLSGKDVPNELDNLIAFCTQPKSSERPDSADLVVLLKDVAHTPNLK
jgi:tRNA A-37 threonylcarbamoyl transferase component Bud32